MNPSKALEYNGLGIETIRVGADSSGSIQDMHCLTLIKIQLTR